MQTLLWVESEFSAVLAGRKQASLLFCTLHDSKSYFLGFHVHQVGRPAMCSYIKASDEALQGKKAKCPSSPFQKFSIFINTWKDGSSTEISQPMHKFTVVIDKVLKMICHFDLLPYEEIF